MVRLCFYQISQDYGLQCYKAVDAIRNLLSQMFNPGVHKNITFRGILHLGPV